VRWIAIALCTEMSGIAGEECGKQDATLKVDASAVEEKLSEETTAAKQTSPSRTVWEVSFTITPIATSANPTAGSLINS
jgi:hypothetical protein